VSIIKRDPVKDPVVDPGMMKKSVTNRGFALVEFTDRNGQACTLQKSSLADEDCVWLGVEDADPKIMARDAARLGLPTNGQSTGWVPYHIPKEVLLSTRMHLNADMARSLVAEMAAIFGDEEWAKVVNGESEKHAWVVANETANERDALGRERDEAISRAEKAEAYCAELVERATRAEEAAVVARDERRGVEMALGLITDQLRAERDDAIAVANRNAASVDTLRGEVDDACGLIGRATPSDEMRFEELNTLAVERREAVEREAELTAERDRAIEERDAAKTAESQAEYERDQARISIGSLTKERDKWHAIYGEVADERDALGLQFAALRDQRERYVKALQEIVDEEESRCSPKMLDVADYLFAEQMGKIARAALTHGVDVTTAPLRCVQCKGVAEEERRAYATPICFACLPPPALLPVHGVDVTKEGE